jgi:hypothetical protein
MLTDLTPSSSSLRTGAAEQVVTGQILMNVFDDGAEMNPLSVLHKVQVEAW